jgi:hypothetical protein
MNDRHGKTQVRAAHFAGLPAPLQVSAATHTSYVGQTMLARLFRAHREFVEQPLIDEPLGELQSLERPRVDTL